MTFKKGLTLASATLVAFTIVGCNKGGSSDIAIVNGTVISQADYHAYLETKNTFTVDPRLLGNTLQNTLESMAQGSPANMPLPQKQTAGFQALRDLVTRAVTLQMAKEEGFTPDQKKVDAEINFQKELSEGFVKNLQNNLGMSMDAIRKQVGFELAQQALITKGITVTDQDVEDFIKANKQGFVEPAEAEVLWMVTRDAKKKAQFDSEISKGRRFKDVALELSEDPNKEKVGAMYSAVNSTQVRAFPQPLQEIVNNTEVNASSDWKEENGTYVKFYIASKKKEKDIEVTAARKEQVRRSIALDRGRQGKDLNVKILERIADAKIEVKDKALAPMWEEYLTEAKAELKKMNGGTGAAAN